MVKNGFFAKGKEGFLKKLLGAGAALITLCIMPSMQTEAHSFGNYISGEFEEFLLNQGGTPYTYEEIKDNGGWVCTKVTSDQQGALGYFENEYDINGYQTKYTYYLENGQTIRKYAWEYDDRGNMTAIVRYAEDGTESGKVISVYDTNGNLIRDLNRNTDGTETIMSERVYDANGKLIHFTSYNSEGEINNYNEFEYDTDGRQIKESIYGPDNELRMWWERAYYPNGNLKIRAEYSANGRKMVWADYNADGVLVKFTQYNDRDEVNGWLEPKYDEKGNQIQYIFYNSDGTISSGWYKNFEYDDAGRKIKSITYDKDRNMTEWSEYIYDTNGNISKKTYYDSNNVLTCTNTFTWEYRPGSSSSIDAGNLIERIDQLPDDGTITVDYSDNAEVSADVFTTIAGTNKDVTFTSEGISWEFSGSDIDASAAKKIDLSTTVTMISKQDQNTASSIENLFGQERNALVLKFADNGKLPGKAKIRINADEALKQYLGTTGLEVFYWDNENNTLVPIASKVSINDDSEIVFEIDHCSYYVVKGRETTKEDKHIPEDVNKDVPEGYEMLFRLYNPNSGEHFYTKSKREGNSLIDRGWNYEGEGWTAPITGTPVYRLYNENAGDHHYTTSEREKNKLVAAGWKYEGIGWYSETAENGKPLYRLYNPNATGAGSHHYTTSTRERDSLIKQGWNDEDIAWYGLKK